MQATAIDTVIDIAASHRHVGISLHVSIATAAIDALVHTAAIQTDIAVALYISFFTTAEHATIVSGTGNRDSRGNSRTYGAIFVLSCSCRRVSSQNFCSLHGTDVHFCVTRYDTLITTAKDIADDIST